MCVWGGARGVLGDLVSGGYEGGGGAWGLGEWGGCVCGGVVSGSLVSGWKLGGMHGCERGVCGVERGVSRGYVGCGKGGVCGGRKLREASRGYVARMRVHQFAVLSKMAHCREIHVELPVNVDGTSKQNLLSHLILDEGLGNFLLKEAKSSILGTAVLSNWFLCCFCRVLWTPFPSP